MPYWRWIVHVIDRQIVEMYPDLKKLLIREGDIIY